MSAWRVVFTDTESATGVAPECPDSVSHGPSDVFDCCPGPHIQCWTERAAVEVGYVLTQAHAEICT